LGVNDTGDFVKYFAYGSNMSLLRLQERVPSAVRIGLFFLKEHQLRFHKASKDGSGKCDAHQTNNIGDEVIGALFDINEDEKVHLDRAEGLGHDYDEKVVMVLSDSGEAFEALIYYAIDTDLSIKPYSWYLNHVVTGAIEINVPAQYLDIIQSIECVEDPDEKRDARQRAMYR
jgi:hypothetical protein